MIVQVTGAMFVGINLVPMTHYTVIMIDAQYGDGNKVVLHFVEGEE